MARTKAVATVAGGKALSQLEQELNSQVADLKASIGAPAGRAIKVKPTGDFISPEGFELGNEIQVVVVDFISKNMFFSGPYDPNNPAPPDCFAMNRVIAEMAPEPDVPNAQADACSGCPLNQFGSGPGGKSKACKNTRELAVLLLDSNNPDAHNDPSAPLYTFSLSPTMLRSFDGFVSTVARTLNRLPVGAIVTMTAQNVGTYASVSFVDPVPNPAYVANAGRRAEAAELLSRKPDFTLRPTPARRQPAARRPAAPVRAAAGARR